jgi:hypothetical protein
MAIESAILGSLVATAGAALMQIISKLKCAYRHSTDGCEPASAFMDGRLEKDREELEVHTIELNGVEFLYAARKRE